MLPMNTEGSPALDRAPGRGVDATALCGRVFSWPVRAVPRARHPGGTSGRIAAPPAPSPRPSPRAQKKRHSRLPGGPDIGSEPGRIVWAGAERNPYDGVSSRCPSEQTAGGGRSALRRRPTAPLRRPERDHSGSEDRDARRLGRRLRCHAQQARRGLADINIVGEGGRRARRGERVIDRVIRAKPAGRRRGVVPGIGREGERGDRPAGTERRGKTQQVGGIGIIRVGKGVVDRIAIAAGGAILIGDQQRQAERRNIAQGRAAARCVECEGTTSGRGIGDLPPAIGNPL